VAYVRTVKAASGATAVQIVWSSRGGSCNIEHVGSAHDGSRDCASRAGVHGGSQLRTLHVQDS
jgi:hypothetical protein